MSSNLVTLARLKIVSRCSSCRVLLSMGWVDPRVGLGWIGRNGSGSIIFVFSGLGWMGLKLQMSCT